MLNSDLRIILLLILLISVALQVRRVTTENEGSRNLLWVIRGCTAIRTPTGLAWAVRICKARIPPLESLWLARLLLLHQEQKVGNSRRGVVQYTGSKCSCLLLLSALHWEIYCMKQQLWALSLSWKANLFILTCVILNWKAGFATRIFQFQLLILTKENWLNEDYDLYPSI